MFIHGPAAAFLHVYVIRAAKSCLPARLCLCRLCLSEMHKTLSDINEHVSAQGSWLPGHQSESSAFKKYWKAGNDEADRRANAGNLTTVTLLPAESPAAVAQCLEPISAHDVVRHLSEVSAVLRQRSNYSLNLISLLSAGPAAADALALIKVPHITPVFFKPPPRPPQPAPEDNMPLNWQRLPGPPPSRGPARNPRHERLPPPQKYRGLPPPQKHRGPPPQNRPFKRSGRPSWQQQYHRPGHRGGFRRC